MSVLGFLGNGVLIASGNPLSPSTTAIRMSSIPRFLSSFITRSQYSAPSFCSIQSPRISLVPSVRRPKPEDRFVSDHPFIANLHSQGVEKDHHVQGLERPDRHALTPSRTSAVTLLIRSGETPIP